MFSIVAHQPEIRQEENTHFFYDPGLRKTQVTSSDTLHKVNSIETAES